MIFEEYNAKREIEKYKSLIKEQRDEIDKRQIIVDSLNASLVRSVQSIFADYSNNMLSSALTGQKEDADEKNKNMFKFVTEDLKERLGIKTKFKIVPYGYDNHAYGFYFTYKDVNFELKIPSVKKANVTNISDMNYGSYCLNYEKHPHIWSMITCSYDLDDIANAIHDFVKGE